MGTTFPRTTPPKGEVHVAQPSLRWRRWPLVNHVRWSWLVIVGILAVAGMVWYLGESWLLAAAAAVALVATLWQFFVPIHYEIGESGLRFTSLGRTRLVSWHAVRAYQIRTTGVVLYQRPDPAGIDCLRSLFLPYPSAAIDAQRALRQHLSHAVELPHSPA
jgi:hypothetical protein